MLTKEGRQRLEKLFQAIYDDGEPLVLRTVYLPPDLDSALRKKAAELGIISKNELIAIAVMGHFDPTFCPTDKELLEVKRAVAQKFRLAGVRDQTGYTPCFKKEYEELLTACEKAFSASNPEAIELCAQVDGMVDKMRARFSQKRARADQERLSFDLSDILSILNMNFPERKRTKEQLLTGFRISNAIFDLYPVERRIREIQKGFGCVGIA